MDTASDQVSRPPHLEQSPPRHQAVCYSRFLQRPTQDISLLRILQLNNIVLHSHQSVQCVRVCVCMCVCVCTFCIIMLEGLSIYTFFGGEITFSISMYIMCVCLFSTLSCRVGALQISIIIIINTDVGSLPSLQVASDFSPRSLTVFIQPQCTIARINVKNQKRWQLYHCLDTRK